MPPSKLHLRSRLASPAALAVVDQACVSLGNAATGLVVARALGPEQFGAFVVANVALWFAVTLQGGLLLRPLAILGAPVDDEEFGRLLGANLIGQVLLVAGSSALVGALVGLWEPLAAVALPAAAAAAAMQCQELCRRALFARGRVGAALASDCVSYDAQAVLCAIAAATGMLTLGSTLLLVTASSLCASALGAWQLRGAAAGLRGARLSLLIEQLRIGGWAAPQAVLANVSQAGYSALVARAFGPVMAAGLGVAGQLLAPINLATRPIEAYLLPRTARAFAHEGEPALRRMTRRATIALAPVYVGYLGLVAAIPEPLIRLVYGGGYVEHAFAVRALALAQLLALPIPILSLEAGVRRLQRWMLLADAWAVVVLLATTVPLVERWGLAGVAASMIAGLAGKVAILAVVTRRASTGARLTPIELNLPAG